MLALFWAAMLLLCLIWHDGVEVVRYTGANVSLREEVSRSTRVSSPRVSASIRDATDSKEVLVSDERVVRRLVSVGTAG